MIWCYVCLRLVVKGLCGWFVIRRLRWFAWFVLVLRFLFWFYVLVVMFEFVEWWLGS